MNPLPIPLELIRKYNVSGPRYTSYPPATRFTDEVDSNTVLEEIGVSNAASRPLSLYFHIPFCETLCWFCGCTTVITPDHSHGALYLDHLEREMDLIAPRLHPQREVVQVHWGGGSPTFLSPSEIRRLGEATRSRFRLAPAHELEASVEIDPRRLHREHVEALRDAGFNRASLGVQDFDPRVQKAIHRIQPRELTAETIGWIREAGFQSLNVDLIYGLPFQTVASFDHTLDEVLRLRPDRLAVFSYAHVPWLKPSQKIFEKQDALPSPEDKLKLLKLVTEKLTGEGGYIYIGMDHFAHPGDELAVAQAARTLQRNFQGYSTRGGTDIHAFGMSAISHTRDLYWQNLKQLGAYQESVRSGRLPVARGCRLTSDDQVRRAVIMEIMCNLGIDYAALSRRLEVDLPRHLATEIEGLADLEADGLLHRTATGIEITDVGRLLVRNIAMRFDAYLPREPHQRFSRTI